MTGFNSCAAPRLARDVILVEEHIVERSLRSYNERGVLVHVGDDGGGGEESHAHLQRHQPEQQRGAARGQLPLGRHRVGSG